MATKKKEAEQDDELQKEQEEQEAAADAKAEAKATAKVMEKASVESPISTAGASPVFRADLGESLPPQKKAGVV